MGARKLGRQHWNRVPRSFEEWFAVVPKVASNVWMRWAQLQRGRVSHPAVAYWFRGVDERPKTEDSPSGYFPRIRYFPRLDFRITPGTICAVFRRRTSLFCLGFAATTMVPACHQDQNSTPEGELIPDSEIVSCGDKLLQSQAAPPTGTFTANLRIDGTRTLLEGTLIWQSSCPLEPAGEETQFWMEGVTVYRDDAGYPGEELGSTTVELSEILTCPNQSKTQDFETEVVDLTAICTEHMQNPTGTSLSVQVELTGRAITCSADEHDLLFRRTVNIDCGPG